MAPQLVRFAVKFNFSQSPRSSLIRRPSVPQNQRWIDLRKARVLEHLPSRGRIFNDRRQHFPT